ncbi:HAMP domain-containing histidine kinase [Clostridium botulinum]|uniref:histidine kinase n=1 Tax=Clostridium botulinum (strain Eklund 17B / Type B) TaxID=935198 RepID=B2TQ07_CLOBB|nr:MULTISPECIES: sensor histidine kinase [unclassified Clostridium]ACD24759.1 integral membrane sensor signal transduction histidine kinase [Clostridium botulinum B str. Eklund 17B (NRP)]KFX56869.1 membrane protein [Clostridium botulinum]KFX59550.1 membrane protein [Clostridium botulinum]MBN1053226.1 sensor histidine kinase [Clostridium botulinum]MBN1056422.1 sensor histidine kinase [Clostridium botulinum]
MKRESILFMIYLYIKEKIKIIVSFLIFILIFFNVYLLYHVSLEPVLYASLLTCTLAFLFSVYDFYKFYNKHVYLCDILNGVEEKLDNLPENKSLIEKDYQSIIISLHKNTLELEHKVNSNYSEMIDYYTMWVHQIKTPISALYMILQSMDSSEYKKIMNQELFKIEEYVEMVLNYLRLESMSDDLRLEEYCLNEIVHDVVKKYAVIFINKKISLDLEELDYKMITDKKWINFVLEQILSNALKYTNNGKISVYMDKKRKDTLIIKDTGIGIKKEDIFRVFERGFTGYNGRMNKKSTGIGLYLCKEILNNLSNKIFITSEVGKGTEVAIDFSRKNIEIY